MRSPDPRDRVSLLERRILYFISGTPAMQMHIALSRDQCSGVQICVRRAAAAQCESSEVSVAGAAINIMQIAQGCNDASRGERRRACRRLPFRDYFKIILRSGVPHGCA
jgi:hypothetical protein